jgi:hypothetical protein
MRDKLTSVILAATLAGAAAEIVLVLLLAVLLAGR